jgi:hypothetical protein
VLQVLVTESQQHRPAFSRRHGCYNHYNILVWQCTSKLVLTHIKMVKRCTALNNLDCVLQGAIGYSCHSMFAATCLYFSCVVLPALLSSAASHMLPCVPAAARLLLLLQM